jgi:hypothetical protein
MAAENSGSIPGWVIIFASHPFFLFSIQTTAEFYTFIQGIRVGEQDPVALGVHLHPFCNRVHEVLGSTPGWVISDQFG